MEQGTIKEIGAHADLMANKSRYQTLIEMQGS
jgi:ABC-type multidrug transport system fused ATPase/permease subunit